MSITSTSYFKPKLMSTLSAWLRRDGGVIVLFVLATLIMTYPVALHLNNEWVASYDADTFMKVWDNWWFNQLVRTGQPLNFTPMLFFPSGLDLTFHSMSWTVAGFNWLLTPWLGSIGAYNFSILIAVLATAYSGYLLIYSMVKHRAAAWLGGAIYSFIPYHITHSGAHPDLAHLAMIPIAVLLTIRAFSSFSWKAAIGASLCLGVAAFTSLYIMVFAFVTLGPVLIYLMLDKHRWRAAKFWKIAVIFGSATALCVGLRVWPIFQSTQTLSKAIEQKYDADSLQTDLLSFVTPSRFNPIFAPLVTRISKHFVMNYNWPAYLGFVPLALCGVAVTWRKRRRLIWLWAAMGLLFLFLSLGPALRLYGQVYDNIPLPAALLAWFSPIRAVRPDFFVLGLALPLAVCAGLGLDRLLEKLGNRPRARAALVISICGLLLFEYWNGPFQGQSTAVSPFYAQLAVEAEPSAVIDLPMGRQESKAYLYLQTIHQQPLVEGLSGRTPSGAYDYIKANAFLTRLRSATPLDCQAVTTDDLKRALDQLAADHFKYVIVHHADDSHADIFAAYLTTAPIYSDASITVYPIAGLQATPPCNNSGAQSMSTPGS